MLKRVKKAYSEEENSPGITLKDYLNFYQVRLILLCMSKPLNILPKGGGQEYTTSYLCQFSLTFILVELHMFIDLWCDMNYVDEGAVLYQRHRHRPHLPHHCRGSH